ncbi:MAG: 30S ribosomal protein S27e [Candidatus Methylarchaceae archaeon HK02M2]|nr:30S ribosomal protein S27e [Candidatus Methylarchaceae archaeon HK02M2]
MKREKIFVPKPRSAFLLVRCSNCGNEQVVFSSSTIDIKCKVCEHLLAQKTGGRAKIFGTILKRLD